MSEAGSLPGKNKDSPPTWSGAAETFQAYEESARLFEQTTPYNKRYLCGPKLQAALEGAALRLVVGKRADWLSDNGGVERLLNHLRQSLGKPQMPELTDLLGRYFRATRRRAGETMNSYITRKTEVYVRCQQALHRVKPHHSRESRPSWTGGGPEAYSDAWYPRDRRNSGDAWFPHSGGQTGPRGNEQGGEENAEPGTASATASAPDTNREAPEATDRSWNGNWTAGWASHQWQQGAWSWGYGSSWQWSPWSQEGWSYPSAAHLEGYPEVVPEFIQAWMLLTDANLESQERNLILTALQGDLTIPRVSQELRNHFPENETQKRDTQRRHQGFLGEADDPSGDEERDTDSVFPAEEELTEEGYAAWSAAEEECHQALVAVEHARRTLKVAREKQKMVKLNRQYFRSSQSSRNSDVKREDKITCLRCGQVGHRAANCPAPHPKEGRPTEMAPFVCYVDLPPELASQTRETQPCLGQEAGFTATVEHGELFDGTSQELAMQTGEASMDLPTTAEAVNAGKAIIDCGATKSLGSVYALEKVMQLSANGVSQVDVHERPVFGFGNSSEDKCVSTVHLNLMAGGRPGHIKVHALDKGSAPILFSVSSLKALGAIVDFGEGTMVMRNVDAQKLVQLEQSRAGHLLLPLTGDILGQAVTTRAPVPCLSSFVQQSADKQVPVAPLDE